MMTRPETMPPNPDALIGAFRRIGPTGPAYQVIAAGAQAHAHVPMMTIRILESGEELDYSLDKILRDPQD